MIFTFLGGSSTRPSRPPSRSPRRAIRSASFSRAAGSCYRAAESPTMLRTRVRAGAVAGLVMSIFAGALFTVVCVGDLYVGWLAPRFGVATPVTLRVPYGPLVVRERGDSSRITYEHTRILIPRGTV